VVRSGSPAGEMLLNIEARIGELADQLPHEEAGRGNRRPSTRPGELEKAGLTDKRAHHAREIASKQGQAAVAPIPPVAASCNL